MGEAVWFKVHKMAMSTTVVLGLLGLVPVLVDRGLDPIRRLEHHPMVGLATLAIALCQPAIAYLRPGKVGGWRARPPGSPLATPVLRRPLLPRLHRHHPRLHHRLPGGQTAHTRPGHTRTLL